MYSQQADLNLSPERLVELTESESVIGAVDQAVIDKLGTRANGRVDAALFNLYITPVATPPDVLISVETAIWKYLLYTHREVMQAPADVLADYNWAVLQLDAWRTDKEALNAPARTLFIAAMVL